MMDPALGFPRKVGLLDGVGDWGGGQNEARY